jgi:amino acid transporter
MRKITKKLAVLAVFSFMIMPVFGLTLTANAQGDHTDTLMWGGYQDSIQTNLGLGNSDPRDMAANVVNIMLGFLGIIAVLIILFGGFKWMTAAGNEDKVSEAKKMIGAGVIGLIIVLAAFGIARFVVEAVYDATDAIG